MKKQYKIAAVAATLGLSLAAIGIGGLAYLHDAKETMKTTTTGSVNIELVEIFDKNAGEDGTTQNHKTFWGVATGTKKSLARASIFCSVETYNVATKKWEVNGQVPSNAIEYNINGLEGWKYNPDDNYYYYQKVLDPNAKQSSTSEDAFDSTDPGMTSQFKITDVKINDAYDSVLFNTKTRINMMVTMETCQATHGAYHLSWGDIPQEYLPSGVYMSQEEFNKQK